ncbi:helix-turn-helix domain-containing protein [Kocuria turfanensis]|uniref:helix-turn-helix domain-containing protein n=1 Tax=Kocuria turfanensis TaxID=388357 RepID=UPI000A044E4D
MTQHPPTTTPGLDGRDAERLAQALESRDVTVFVDGTSLRLPEGARGAVLDLLSRLTRGESVTVSSARQPLTGSEELLTTSQAAALAGISHTYLRNLTSEGVIPVQYRGSHRRIRRSDVQTWLARHGDDAADTADAAEELLTTSQAAALAGISHTYLRNLTSEGVIPVQYRGSHRRIRRSDVQAWLAGRQRADAGGASASD